MNKNKLENIVEAFKNGDETAFDRLYEETKTDVYYTILLVLKDPSLSEDIMQDTYLKMIENIQSYKRKGEFKAWLKTIAKRLAINAYNKRKKETPMDAAENPNLFESENRDLEKRYYLEKLLNVLNEEEKTIVIRHAVLGDKHKDIAEDLKKPLGTVLWKYQNALEKMRKEGGEFDER